jgi:DNA-binding NarL/FixJ family response regulator
MEPLKLSPAERRMCDLLIAGCPNKEIAKRAGITLRTVKHHFNRAFARNGISDGLRRIRLAVRYYYETNGGFENADWTNPARAAE